VNIGSSVVTNRVCDAVKLGRFEEHLSGQSCSFLINKYVDPVADGS
jgi:hypothetical protein